MQEISLIFFGFILGLALAGLMVLWQRMREDKSTDLQIKTIIVSNNAVPTTTLKIKEISKHLENQKPFARQK